MENRYQYRLIKGVFTPSEAGKVLFTLIQNKISYHHVEILATNERSDSDVSHSETRVRELLEVRNSLKEVLELAEDLQMEVKVDGFIEIKLLK